MEKWRFKTGGGIVANPSIDKEGIIYFSSWDHNVYALGGSPKEKNVIQEKKDQPLKKLAVNNTKETEQFKKIPLSYITIAVIVIVVIVELF